MVSELSSASFLYVPSVGVDVFACVCDVDACGVGVKGGLNHIFLLAC